MSRRIILSAIADAHDRQTLSVNQLEMATRPKPCKVIALLAAAPTLEAQVMWSHVFRATDR